MYLGAACRPLHGRVPGPGGWRKLNAETNKHVFLSYQREDEAEADKLKALLTALDHKVWIDKEDIRSGEPWWDQLLEAIRSSYAVVLAVSPRYLESEACRTEWQYALKLNRIVVPIEVIAVEMHLLPREIYSIQMVRENQPIKLRAALAEPLRQLPNPLPDPPAQLLDWPIIREIVKSTESVYDNAQFAAAVTLIESIWSPVASTPKYVPELALEFLRRDHLDTRARRLLQGALQPVSVSWQQARSVAENPSSADGRTQVAVAIRLVEGLWSPAPDAPADILGLATGLHSDPATDPTAQRLLHSVLQPVSVSWGRARSVVKNPSSADARTQVAVADKLVEGLRSPDQDTPTDISRLATDLHSHPDTDPTARRVLLPVPPIRRGWLPVIGAMLGGLALTHLFWFSGLYGYANRVLGSARGPITINAFLALVGIALCVAARTTNLKAARLGLLLCTVGVVATLLDAIKIGWIL